VTGSRAFWGQVKLMVQGRAAHEAGWKAASWAKPMTCDFDEVSKERSVHTGS
jgi:hypothetical protein